MTTDLSNLADKLTVVLGFCELMLEERYGKLPDPHKAVLGEVFEAARGAKDIVRSAAGGMISGL